MAVRQNNVHPLPDPALVRSQLEKIAASPMFAQSERLREFLQIIVEAALCNTSSRLKETVIGVEVYRRNAGYDPQTDPIVRTEAHRLRTKLRQYYDHEGQHDRVVIRLPSGHYVPEFEVRPELAPTLVAIEDKRASRPRLPRKKILMVAAGVAIAAAAAVWLFHFIHQSSGSTKVVPVANYPGYEFDPSLSPDGREVAFVWNKIPGDYNIFVKLIGTESSLQLTTDKAPIHDVHPVWSPDARHIAFLKISPGKKEIYIVPALGGPERFVCSSAASRPAWIQDASSMSVSDGPAWSPDGRSLAITDSEEHQGPDSIYSVLLESARKTKLTSPSPTDLGDYFPAFSPDGHYLAFVRAASQRGITDIYVRSLSTDRVARRITFDQKTISGLTWASNRELVFSSNRSGRNMLWQISSRGGTPRAIDAAGWNATNPAARPGKHQLVYTRSFQVTDVWRASLSGTKEQHTTPTVEVIGSQGENDSAQISPGGDRIAFISDRSGSRQLWVCNADGSNPIQLTFSEGLPVGTPRWSPDGREIAYDSVKDGRSAIYVINVQGGIPRLFASDHWDDMMPSWSRDGQFIYFLARRDAKHLEMWKKKTGAGGPTILVSKNADGEALESTDGRMVYYASPRGGIWKVPADGGSPTIVPELASVGASRYIFVTRSGIYFLATELPPWRIQFYSFTTQSISPVLIMEKSPLFYTSSLSVAPDEDWLIYSQRDQSGSQVMMISRP